MKTRTATVMAALLLCAAQARAADTEAVVRAVLFVSPTCPHCRTVKAYALPALAERFGPRLRIATISTATPDGLETFRAACQRFGVQRPGVPMLVVNDEVLLGSFDIPTRLPALADGLLEAGGCPWPDLPGLAALLPHDEPRPATGVVTNTPDETPGATPDATPDTTPPARPAPDPSPTTSVRTIPPDPPAAARNRVSEALDRAAADPRGSGLALIVLAAMIAVTARSLLHVHDGRWPRVPDGWAVPGLCLAGLGVASYLSWVEVGGHEAVCGPVGDCNAVQQSEYAMLFGVLPVGVLGVIGFAAMLAVWSLGRVAADRVGNRAGIALFAMTGLGTLFSIYLTFLEPFVIGATCMWCLSSATIMTLLHSLSQRQAGAGAGSPARRREARPA